MIRAAGSILRKDLRLRLRDRSVLVFAFVVPLGLSLVFGLILPSEDDFLLTAGIVVDDDGPIGQAFARELLPQLVEAGFVEVRDFDDAPSARAAIDGGEVSVAWILPADLSATVNAGDGGAITVLHNPDRLLSTEVARSIARGFLGNLDRVRAGVVTALNAGLVDPADVSNLVAQASGVAPLANVAPLVAEHRQLDATSYLGAGMAVFFLFFTVTFGITGMLEERDQKTLPRLLAAPIHPTSIHVGKAAGAFIIGLVSMTVLAVGNRLVLGVDWGPIGGIAVMVVAGVLCAIGVMALVGSFAKTAEQAGNLQSIVAMAFGLSGGVFFPVGASGFMANLSLFSPHGWFLRGLADQVGSGVWTATLPAAAVLVAIGLVTGALGGLRMQRSMP